MQPQNNVQNGAPVAPQPVKTAPVVPQPVTAAPVKGEPKKDNLFENAPKKKGKGMLLGLVFCILLAAGGIAFGVWTMMDSKTQKEQLNSQISTLKTQNNELMDKLDAAVSSSNTTDETTTSNVDTANYIYVGEWGLKIKIPESLNAVGYKFSEGTYGEYLSLAGVKGEGVQNSFQYTDVDNFFAGTVLRSNSDDGFYPYGSLVYTDDEQNKYYFEGPQADMGSTNFSISSKIFSLSTFKPCKIKDAREFG